MINNGYAVSGIAGGWGQGILEPQGHGVKVMALRIGWSAQATHAGYVAMDYAARLRSTQLITARALLHAAGVRIEAEGCRRLLTISWQQAA